jgi:hypothetical protein
MRLGVYYCDYRVGRCDITLEMKFDLVLLNPIVACMVNFGGVYLCLLSWMSPRTKETLLKFTILSCFWEVFKVSVASPDRVDIWGVTVGIRARL